MQSGRVIYCGACTFPLEYCEYSGVSKSKCDAWLQANYPNLSSNDVKEIQDRIQSTSLSTSSSSASSCPNDNINIKQSKNGSSNDATDQAGETLANTAKKQQKKSSNVKVIIKTDDRNKRKSVTNISHLESFGIDLKKMAKKLAGKFATGCSVVKGGPGTGGDFITLQGDFSYDVEEFLNETYSNEIPKDSIEIVEGKRK